MALIFINRFFHPDISATSQILSDLAFALARQGRSVRVITSRLRYDDAAGLGSPLPAREVVDGVEIHRVPTSRFGRGTIAGRAVDYLTFYLAAGWTLWRHSRRGDVVVAKTDPPMMSVVAAPLCRLRGARLVNWLQDLFPEVAQAYAGGRARFGLGALARLRTASLKAAVLNVVIGHGMAKRLDALGLGPSVVRLVPNWADGAAIRPIPHADNPFRHALGVGEAFVVGYSGNLGRVHDVATVVDAMAILAARNAPRPVRWLFIGGGALTPVLKTEIARRHLSGVTFLPYQPRSALAHSLSAPDAHLGSLRPEFEGLIVPSKIGGATAAGRPILFVGDPEGEVGRLIARHACGFAIRAGDGAALADAITALSDDPALGEAMGRRARQAFEAEFDRDLALARWTRLLDEAEGLGRAHAGG